MPKAISRLGIFYPMWITVFAVWGTLVSSTYAQQVLYSLSTPSGFSETQVTGESQIIAGGQTAGEAISSASSSALIWSLPNGSTTNLAPAGFLYSEVDGTNGTQQVGDATVTTGISDTDAFLWNGTTASAVNLGPSGYTLSKAFATNGTQQVGYGYGTPTGDQYNALLWTDTAASFVDLHPTGLTGSGTLLGSGAYGNDAGHQVGFAQFSLHDVSGNHAILWSGTAASAVDLNPSTATQSTATGVSGDEEVGLGTVSGTLNAFLWTGTAASAVDLNPTNQPQFTYSFAYGTNGTEQVGGAQLTLTGQSQAMLWTQTASSSADLGLLLPASGSWTNSTAYTINGSDDVYGLANGTYEGVTGTFAIEWLPTVCCTSAISGNWTATARWTPGTVPTSAINAMFCTGSATAYTATLTNNSTANTLTVQGDHVTIAKAGHNLTVGGALIIAGTPSQNALLALSGTGTNTFGSLNINGGQLDITDNAVIVNYGKNPSPLAAIGSYIASGYNGDAWNGVGIMSSKVASVNASNGNPHLYGIGYADASDPAVASDHFASGTVVIEPALIGDANLDGVVNYTDFQLLSANFNGTGTSWDEGDFNYDGNTNYTDFQLLAANFNDSTSLDAAQFNTMNQFAGRFGDALVANAYGIGFSIVPEPASGTLLALAAMGLLSPPRRRRA